MLALLQVEGHLGAKEGSTPDGGIMATWNSQEQLPADIASLEAQLREEKANVARLEQENETLIKQNSQYKEDLDREKAKNKKLWNAPLARESRQERAREMFAKYDFTPFIEEGVDMATTYHEGVRCMYSIFT